MPLLKWRGSLEITLIVPLRQERNTTRQQRILCGLPVGRNSAVWVILFIIYFTQINSSPRQFHFLGRSPKELRSCCVKRQDRERACSSSGSQPPSLSQPQHSASCLSLGPESDLTNTIPKIYTNLSIQRNKRSITPLGNSPFSMVRLVQKIRDVRTSENQTSTSIEPELTVKRVFTVLNMIMIPKFLELGSRLFVTT